MTTIEKFVPTFLWMKEKDIHEIRYCEDYIIWLDERWNLIYSESKHKRKIWKHDIQGLPVYSEDSRGNTEEREHNQDGNEIFFKDRNGYKRIQEYKNYKIVYRADTNGDRMQMVDGQEVEYRDWKFYIDWAEADIVIRNK